MVYDPRIHHRRSIRLCGWDYARPAAYFVTLCTIRKQPLFGAVVDCEMRLNECGRIVAGCWEELPQHYPMLCLDAFVIMPNHAHGVIEITAVGASVGAGVGAGLRPAPTDIERQSIPLSEIIRAFKAFSSRRINLLRGPPGTPLWQRNYYEHIIRNPRELTSIRDYIATNPVRWDTDPENPAATSGDPKDWLP